METALYNSNMPADYQHIDDEDPRLELFTLYGDHVFESLEEFCDKMADKYGDNWISILKT